MFPCIVVCKHVPLRNSGGRLIRWPWVLFPPTLRCNVQGYDFRFTYAQLHSREFSKDTSRQCLFLSEVISLCPTRWKNLDYRIYLGTFLHRHFSSLFSFLLLSPVPCSPFVFDSPSYFQRFYEVLPVHFSHAPPYFTTVKYCLSFFKGKDLLFPDFVHFPRQIFPFSLPVYSLYSCHAWNTSFVGLLGLLNISMDLLLAFSSGIYRLECVKNRAGAKVPVLNSKNIVPFKNVSLW